MPDITMCLNKECTKKETCYRFIAKPSPWQSYCMFEFEIIKGETYCDFYWPLHQKEN